MKVLEEFKYIWWDEINNITPSGLFIIKSKGTGAIEVPQMYLKTRDLS